MKNRFVIGASLLAAMALTLILLMGTFADKEDVDVPSVTAPAVTQPVPTPPEGADKQPDTANPSEDKGGTAVSSHPEDKERRSVSQKASVDTILGYAIAVDGGAGALVPAEKLPVATVSFVACGDNLVHGSVYTDAKTLAAGTDREYNFLPMYENVTDIIRGADLAFINQETPFGGDSRPISGYPMFNTPDEMGDDIAALGFDIVGMANNHMLDSTSAGYLRTIEFWEEKDGILAIGGYKNKEDFENIRILEKNGIKIAFLAYTYGTNGLTLPKNSELVVPLYDDDVIDRQTKRARELADCVIVSIHWGTEDSYKPSEAQRRKAQIMVDNGVDVIIGHHPHVLQPMKWADRPDGGKTLIMYSLGNILSGMMYSRNMVGGFMGFDIVKAPNGTSVENACFIPTVCQYNSSVRGFKIYRFSEYTEELQKAHGAHKFDSGMSMRGMRKIIDDAIPKEFLVEDFYS